MKNILITSLITLIFFVGLSSCGDDPMDEMSIELSISDDAINAGAPFGVRSFHQMVSFKDSLWVIGGIVSGIGPFRNDVWKSGDGITWTKVIENAVFEPVATHKIVEFNNTLYMYGGSTASGNINDIYNSEDGETWELLAPNPAFSERSSHTATVFKNKIYIIGGNGSNNYTLFDAWRSDDAAQFTQIGPTPFVPRDRHSATVFDDKLWVIGGRFKSIDTSYYHNDVWFTEDGLNWIPANQDAPFGKRGNHTVIVHNGKMWMIGGRDGNENYYDDVWSSADGINWAKTNENVPYGGRIGSGIAALNNKIYLSAGFDDNFNSFADVWQME